MIFDLKAARVLSKELCSTYFTTKYNPNIIANYLISVNVLSIKNNSKHDTSNYKHTP